MKFYIITDRELREIAHVVGEEARRPLLEFIRNLMREVHEIFLSSASRGRPVVPHRALAGW